jgi:hypothetical protein
MPTVAPSAKPTSAISKKKKRMYPKPSEKPERIEAMLREPSKRCHLGPCCVTMDGSICGSKKWGDGKGSKYADGTIFYECFGCRGELEKPPVDGATSDDVDIDAAAWEAIDKAVAAYHGASSSRV